MLTVQTRVRGRGGRRQKMERNTDKMWSQMRLNLVRVHKILFAHYSIHYAPHFLLCLLFFVLSIFGYLIFHSMLFSFSRYYDILDPVFEPLLYSYQLLASRYLVNWKCAQYERYHNKIGWNVNQTNVGCTIQIEHHIEQRSSFIIMTCSTNRPETYNWIGCWNGIALFSPFNVSFSLSLSHSGSIFLFLSIHSTFNSH